MHESPSKTAVSTTMTHSVSTVKVRGPNLQVLNNAVTGPPPIAARDPVGIFLASRAQGLIEGNAVTNNTDATCVSSEQCDFVGVGIPVFATAMSVSQKRRHEESAGDERQLHRWCSHFGEHRLGHRCRRCH